MHRLSADSRRMDNDGYFSSNPDEGIDNFPLFNGVVMSHPVWGQSTPAGYSSKSAQHITLFVSGDKERAENKTSHNNRGRIAKTILLEVGIPINILTYIYFLIQYKAID